jgi:hypothetical protein
VDQREPMAHKKVSNPVSHGALSFLIVADRVQGFQIRRPGYRFFKRGVVFRVLWPELAGDANQNITIATTGAFGEQTFYKIRWFVVIREGHNFCTCL